MKKYIQHIPTGCCYELKEDGKTIEIRGCVMQPAIDGEIFWRYVDHYMEKKITPVDPFKKEVSNVISKKFFCDLLNTVKNIEKKFDYLEKFLGQPICECDFYDYTAGILDMLVEETGLEKIDICEDLIHDFAYNHDWGNDGEVSVNIDGVDKTASNLEELYDLIMEIVGKA